MIQQVFVTCGIFKGIVIVTKLELSVHHIHGIRLMLEWKLLSSRVSSTMRSLRSSIIVCAEGNLE